jgi:hypothetical protein
MDVAEEPHGAVAVDGSPGSDSPFIDVAHLAVLPALVSPVAVLPVDAVEHDLHPIATAMNYLPQQECV